MFHFLFYYQTEVQQMDLPFCKYMYSQHCPVCYVFPWVPRFTNTEISVKTSAVSLSCLAFKRLQGWKWVLSKDWPRSHAGVTHAGRQLLGSNQGNHWELSGCRITSTQAVPISFIFSATTLEGTTSYVCKKLVSGWRKMPLKQTQRKKKKKKGKKKKRGFAVRYVKLKNLLWHY